MSYSSSHTQPIDIAPDVVSASHLSPALLPLCWRSSRTIALAATCSLDEDSYWKYDDYPTRHYTAYCTPAHGTPMAVSAVSASLRWRTPSWSSAIMQNLTCPSWYQLTYKTSCLNACWSSPVSFSLSPLYYYIPLYQSIFTKHHDLRLSRTPQRNGSIRFRRSLVLPACPSDALCQCQQRHCRPHL